MYLCSTTQHKNKIGNSYICVCVYVSVCVCVCVCVYEYEYSLTTLPVEKRS